jgi:hypothetical protein
LLIILTGMQRVNVGFRASELIEADDPEAALAIAPAGNSSQDDVTETNYLQSTPHSQTTWPAPSQISSTAER